MWETVVHLAVAGGVYDGVFCAVLFRDVLDGILDLIESLFVLMVFLSILTVRVLRGRLLICVCVSLPLGIEGSIWDLIFDCFIS